ncbi:hypothetical protein F8O06_10800 [Pseudoclavibacter sp. CFCC 14310]|uniref:DUF5979 domain-containing protein n=1 Tax=Pseudoclavibacter sp. CFCC 14310 TaxID=2615180 RepID=UPI00130166E3|nr:DUF5979 domain-containing protein [Pseudoclavibacter sp. CFCC 14310]KAB1644513.1 hypothetical protein F8O06_10800 [Pseudoclavibacter sp. CFCC 14310]
MKDKDMGIGAKRHVQEQPATNGGRRKRLLSGMLGIVSAFALVVSGFAPAIGSLAQALPAVADELPEYLAISKSVDGADLRTLEPGQSFTYQIDLKCSESNCLNAQAVDRLPSELQGFRINGVEVTPNEVGGVVTWKDGESTVPQPQTVGADTGFVLDLNQAFPGGKGLADGTTAHINVTLQVPADFSPDDPRNGQTITNTAKSTADNSRADEDSADVVVKVDQRIDAAVDKGWTPAKASYNPGDASTITLKSSNTSNVTVDSLVVQEPQSSDATDGAAALAENNPFRITDFTGFGTSQKPAGADTVQVDAYVKGEDGQWHWVTGTPGVDFVLPAGVTNDEVGGLRFTYQGALAPRAADDIQLQLVQRATDRNDDSDLSTKTSTIANVAQAQTAKGDAKSEVKTDDATYTVAPSAIATSVDKSFTPSRLPAGNTTTGTILAKNTASPVKTLTISDNSGFFSDTTKFSGFTDPIAYPDSATSGKVVFHMSDGTTKEVAFADGDTPQTPAGVVTGFDVVFGAETNSIISNGQTTVKFRVSTTSDVDFGDETTLTSTNTATSNVEAANGQTGTDSDSADLTIIKPAVNVHLDKTLKPADNVEPGQEVVAEMKSTAESGSDYVKPTKIVVEDSWADDKPADGFWNAFDLASIQPTQVPAGASLTVEVQKADGSWITLDTKDAQTGASLYQLSAADLAAKLNGVSADSLTGIRFTFEKPADDPFPASATVRPYVSYTARENTRLDASTPTDQTDGDDDAQQKSTKYQNSATTKGTGTTDDGTEISGTDDAQADTGVIVYPGDHGTGPASHISKVWDRDSVAAQSGDVATTHLNWRVSKGITQARITDPQSDLETPKNTVFDAFDLTAVNGVQVSNDAYSNGWFMKYDTVASIELYSNGAWHTVAPTGGAWQQPDGSFKGYRLTPDEKANSTAVRVTVVPNDVARTAALENGTDPYAPAPGSGVAASSADRTFDLVWTLRNKTRSDGSFVTANSALNNGLGAVDNSVAIDGTTANGTTHDEDDDTIVVRNYDPSVAVTKDTRAQQPIQVPAPATVPAAQYPTNSYTLTAHNNALSRASYVRVTDPTPCDDTNLSACPSAGDAAGALANPFLDNADVQSGAMDTDPGTPNPFNRQNITKITVSASVADEVDLTKSKVWLLHFTPGAPGSETGQYSFSESTAAEVNALPAGSLADVVGISVTYQGTDPVSTGGTISAGNALSITIDTQVRDTLRTTGAEFVPKADELKVSKNRVFAQSYDPVLAPDTKTGDTDDATVNYTTGTIDVKPGKSITSGSITAVDPKAAQTVTLTADQGASSVSPTRVDITDQPDGDNGSDGFWTNFDFTGLGAVTFPAGADRVVVSAYGPFGAGNVLSWKDSEPQPKTAGTFAVPVDAADYSAIQGLKFTFTRADGSVFSTTTPNWSAGATFTAVLRDTVRGGDAAVAFPDSATDKVTAQSTGLLDTSDEKPATAPVTWTTGTAKLAIDKLANGGARSASVGSMVPWDITISNAGTGFLDLTQVVDTLPAALKFTGSGSPADPGHPVQFTPGTLPDGSPGSLKTAPTTDSSAAGKVVFTWPQGDSRLQPGETAVIRIWLELQPGPASGERVTNNVSAFTEQTLDSVSDAKPNNGAGAVTADGEDGAQTSDYVSPTLGENLYVVKGVNGALDGAVNTLDPTQNCTSSLQGYNGRSYYRSPCAANSTINGTDQWVLHMVNAGTTDVKRAQFFDQLPVPGDKYLVASGNDRGSAYRPQLLDDLQVIGAPAGTTQTVEVTSDANACVATWGTLPAAGSACAANSWTAADGDTDWSKVSGIRVTLDFTTSSQGALKPGQGADVTYSSRNTPKSAADVTGAATDIPALDQFAWNQFGLLYTGDKTDKIAPSLVGTHLRTGSIEVTKAVTGEAGAYAPNAFTANVVCTIPAKDGQTEVPLTFGGQTSKQVTLTKQSDGTYAAQRVSGIPVGASCDVKEDGEAGHFGETTRNPADGVSLQISEPDAYASGSSDKGEPTNKVPAAQVADLANDYQWSGLSVTKKVDTQADSGTFGPFAFAVRCTTSDGQTVRFGDADRVEFTLEPNGTWTAPAKTIPARSDCTIAETDSDKADSTVITGDNVRKNDDGSATVNVGTDASAVVSTLVTNHYDAGTLTVGKKINGPGAEKYGTGAFEFHAICTYDDDQTLLDETFSLLADETKTFGVYPAGTECHVDETKTGAATATSLDPDGGDVTIAHGDAVTNVTATATNTYDVGSLQIDKSVVGDGAELYGAGPFEAQAICTYDRDGEQQTIDLANDGRVALNAANGYSATIGNLLKGSSCTVTETKSAGATASALDPADGTVVVGGENDDPVTVNITNTFEVGSIDIVKKRVGVGADAYGKGPFEAQAVCTYQKDGEQTPIELPNDGRVELSEQNGYRASIDDLLVGADCKISETETGGADVVSIDPQDGEITVDDRPGAQTVTITNEFNTAPPTDEGGLARTGETIGAVLFGAAVLLGGAGLMLLARSRRKHL